MGTRALTFVYDDDDRPIINLYRQHDGYPSAHGRELAEFLTSIKEITNGIRMDEARKTANGMSCLAAQIVAHFKKDVGSFYLYNIEDTDHCQDYEYHVYIDRVEVYRRNSPVFDGPWDDFETYCNICED